MALSKNLKHVGMAAYNEKRDMQDWLESQEPSMLTDIDHAMIEQKVAAGYYADMKSFHGEEHPVTKSAYERLQKANANLLELQKSDLILEETPTNPLIYRREIILAAFKEGNLTEEEENELICELAEIETAMLGENPDATNLKKTNRPYRQ